MEKTESLQKGEQPKAGAKKDTTTGVEAKLNLDFVTFVLGLKSEEIVVGNAEKLKANYEKQVGLKWTNMSKVGARVLRPQVKEKLQGYLKEEKIKPEDFRAKTKQLLAVVSSGKATGKRYI